MSVKGVGAGGMAPRPDGAGAPPRAAWDALDWLGRAAVLADRLAPGLDDATWSDAMGLVARLSKEGARLDIAALAMQARRFPRGGAHGLAMRRMAIGQLTTLLRGGAPRAGSVPARASVPGAASDPAPAPIPAPGRPTPQGAGAGRATSRFVRLADALLSKVATAQDPAARAERLALFAAACGKAGRRDWAAEADAIGGALGGADADAQRAALVRLGRLRGAIRDAGAASAGMPGREVA